MSIDGLGGEAPHHIPDTVPPEWEAQRPSLGQRFKDRFHLTHTTVTADQQGLTGFYIAGPGHAFAAVAGPASDSTQQEILASENPSSPEMPMPAEGNGMSPQARRRMRRRMRRLLILMNN